jgi:hypothetical protein
MLNSRIDSFVVYIVVYVMLFILVLGPHAIFGRILSYISLISTTS